MNRQFIMLIAVVACIFTTAACQKNDDTTQRPVEKSSKNSDQTKKVGIPEDSIVLYYPGIGSKDYNNRVLRCRYGIHNKKLSINDAIKLINNPKVKYFWQVGGDKRIDDKKVYAPVSEAIFKALKSRDAVAFYQAPISQEPEKFSFTPGFIDSPVASFSINCDKNNKKMMDRFYNSCQWYKKNEIYIPWSIKSKYIIRSSGETIKSKNSSKGGKAVFPKNLK